MWGIIHVTAGFCRKIIGKKRKYRSVTESSEGWLVSSEQVCRVQARFYLNLLKFTCTI